jgi:hypothetical protein
MLIQKDADCIHYVRRAAYFCGTKHIQNMAFSLEETRTTAKRAARRMLWISLFLAVLAGAAYYIYRTWEYSDGSRTGRLFKISRKGTMMKTYEGQLHLGGSAMMTEQSVWDFSVKNASIYDQVQKLEGSTVRCYYREVNHAFPWQGETNYIVYKVEAVE